MTESDREGPQGYWRLTGVTLPGRVRPRLDNVTLEIPPGVTAILGSSGSGKTSLLNLLVGFETPATGVVSRESRVTSQEPGSDRLLSACDGKPLCRQTRAFSSTIDVFWSPADHGLWPHLTVREHLGCVGLTNQLEQDRLLKRFDLNGLADHRPEAFSLGERDRLAVARAVASGAAALVLDEPFAHVDFQRRELGWSALRELVADAGQSIVFSTQQPEMALRDAAWVIIFEAGRVLATGPPRPLYEAPANATVAAMLGPMTWLPHAERELWISPAVEGCLRPERLAVKPASTESPLQLMAQRSAGVYDVVDVRHRDVAVSRRFFVSPSHSAIAPGTPIILRLLFTGLMMLALLGCETNRAPVLSPVAETVWTLPAEGPRVPAPRGVTPGPAHTVYVLDNIGRVLQLDALGNLKQSWWMPEYSVGKPERLLVCRDGRLVVADTHYHRIVVFNQDGQVQSMFGREGQGRGEFIYPVAIAEDDRQNLYVCEYGGHDRVQVFRRDGTYVSEFGRFGVGPGEFQRPSGIAWRDGRLYIVDAFNNRVHVCNEAGDAVSLPPGAFSAELHYPYDVGLDGSGAVYVVEYGAGRITKFSPTGELVGRRGSTGAGAGQFSTPWGLGVAESGEVFVADTGNRRVVRWEYR